jgi:hypothetical protein
MIRIFTGIGLAVGGIGALVILAVVIGMALPVKHQVSMRETFPVPAAKLWAMSVAIFHRTNNGMFAITETDPPHRLVTAIVGKNLPFGGTWTYEFVTIGENTTLTVTERGEIYNPFFRFVSRFLMGYEGSLKTFFVTLCADARGDVPEEK